MSRLFGHGCSISAPKSWSRILRSILCRSSDAPKNTAAHGFQTVSSGSCATSYPNFLSGFGHSALTV